MLAPVSRSYRLVYIPYSKYPSVVMLEYLVASMKELPAELNSALIQAVQQELSAEEGIILLADEPKRSAGLGQEIDAVNLGRVGTQPTLLDAVRPYNFDGQVDQSVHEATRSVAVGVSADLVPLAIRPQFYGLEMEEEKGTIRVEKQGQYHNVDIDGSFRTINQPTRVFREVHISKNVARNLNNLRLNDLAYRMKEQQLFIDVADSAQRIVTSDLSIQKGGDGHRISNADALVGGGIHGHRERIVNILHPKENLFASRISTEEAVIPWTSILANRMMNRHQTSVIQEHVWGQTPERYLRSSIGRGFLASRNSVAEAWINLSNVLGERKIIAPVLLGAQLEGARKADQNGVLQKIIRAKKLSSQLLFIDRSITRAKLKARQYPSHLIAMLQAIRDLEWDTHLSGIYKAGRKGNQTTVISQQSLGFRQKLMASDIIKANINAQRVITRGKHLWIVKNELKGERIIQKFMPKSLENSILREVLWGRREHEVDSYIERNFSLATRDVKTDTWVIRSLMDGGVKGKRDLFIGRERLEGSRAKEKMIYVPRNVVEGSSRTPKQTFISWNSQATRMEAKEMYLDYIKQAQRESKQRAYLDSSVESDMRPKDSVIDELIDGNVLSRFALSEEEMLLSQGHFPLESSIGEDWLGTKQLIELRGLMEEALTAEVKKSREGLTEEVFAAVRENEGLGALLIEKMVVAHIIREMPAYILEVIYANKEFPAELMDDVLVGIRDNLTPSLIEIFDILAEKQALGGFIEEFIVGAKARLESLIESGIVGFQESKPSLLTFGWESSRETLSESSMFTEEPVAYEEAKPSVISSDRPVAEQEAKPSVISSDRPMAEQEAKPSILPEGLTGIEEGKPSVFSVSMSAFEESKPSYVGKDILADDVFRPTVLQIENPLGYFEPDESFIPESTEATKPTNHSAEIDSSGSIQAQEPERPAAMGMGTEAEPPVRGFEMIDNPLAEREGRASLVAGGDYEALIKKRIAELSTEFVFGAGGARAGHIADVYFLGEAGVRKGFIPEIEWSNYAKLALEQAIISEGMFATDPNKAALLVESILAYKGLGREAAVSSPELTGDRQPSYADFTEEEDVLGNRGMNREGDLDEKGISGQPEPQPTYLNLDFIGSKLPGAVQIIEGILADKELAESIMLDYIAAKKRGHDALMDEPLNATEQIKKAFLDRITEMGQGLSFDYRDDIIEDGMNPEDWEGGFGVPEDYDPHNPFNDYYPWTEERDQLMLGQDDWIRMDNEHQENWRRDKDLGEFYCVNANPGVTGFYRNDFKHGDYVFEVSFKVNEATGDDGAGILFRYTDPQNYYMFMIHGGDSGDTLGMLHPMQLFRVRGGKTEMLGSPMNAFSWVQGKWYQLQVSVISNRIKLLVNGRLQYDFTD
ncbi:family 16 glycoside hydrolase [Paenibacillus sp. 22594]|uniref:family 16 glycoside hydrolase n=1 Tax=Paenibacillus sp. 22594 TaxID=3453947 RepID=UPI003F85BE1E